MALKERREYRYLKLASIMETPACPGPRSGRRGQSRAGESIRAGQEQEAKQNICSKESLGEGDALTSLLGL